MKFTRRQILWGGGGLVAAAPFLAKAGDTVAIGMQGRADGSQVWFDPVGILIRPGQTIRWINRDPGNSHTATAYHPANFDRPRRMPDGVKPWNSDYLLPDETFSVTFRHPGIYDYYCVPHEHAGMVGRIVVGSPQPPGWIMAGDQAQDVPDDALRAFPAIEDIMRSGTVRRT